jgi:dolichol-phosphate mannosyltransferase
MPVYNEGPGIECSVKAIAGVARRYPGRAMLIAVDDGSSDGSGDVLRRLESEIEPLEVCVHERNAGYGVALRTGAARAGEAGLDYVAFIDSDLTNPPEDLLKIGELARAGNPYLKASRFIRGGGMSTVPLSRRLVSKAGNLVGRHLLGTRVRDVTNGFRAVRTDLFLSWPLQERGFPVIVEELDWALRSGIQPVEFPTVLSERSANQRGTAFTYSPRLVLSYLRYPARALVRRARDAMRRSP